jgi:two-component system phosphate regulon response regulator PhoB
MKSAGAIWKRNTAGGEKEIRCAVDPSWKPRKEFHTKGRGLMKKILIVDDREEVRELVEVTLRSEEYLILQAESGEKALAIAGTEKPDLIFMDIMMPGGMDGLETTRILRNSPETRDCPIIMLTAKGQDYDRTEGLKAGATDYFVKPFSPLELLKKVEEVLKHRSAAGDRDG